MDNTELPGEGDQIHAQPPFVPQPPSAGNMQPPTFPPANAAPQPPQSPINQPPLYPPTPYQASPGAPYNPQTGQQMPPPNYQPMYGQQNPVQQGMGTGAKVAIGIGIGCGALFVFSIVIIIILTVIGHQIQVNNVFSNIANGLYT